MKGKTLIYYGLPILGILICLWYVKSATYNIVYTDYIRLVNSYLPDIWNPEKFFVPDILTRIPIHYLGRMINVLLFDYSTTFDMVLGVLGLGLSGVILGDYCKKRKLGLVWYVLFMFVLFGLNKWEMLTNGTGWGHFLAFACFYYHYVVFDQVVNQKEKPYHRYMLLILPLGITLTVAGPYCAVYSVLMILCNTWMVVRTMKLKKKKEMSYWICCTLGVVLSLLLYMWSNSYAVENHAGAVDVTLGAAFMGSPEFFPKFLLKALASMVIGGETLSGWIQDGVVRDGMVYLLGGVVGVGYLLALYLNVKFSLYKRTILPLMLLIGGIGNHGIVLISRFIFLRENYGMSSRYALQYQVGILGMLLTFGFLWKKMATVWQKSLVALVCVFVLCGQGYTNYKEWNMAPHREHYAENIAAVALRFEEESDDVLRETFDYRREEADSGAKVRQALRILKDNGWNVFAQ